MFYLKLVSCRIHSVCLEVWPEEGELLSVHPGRQSQTRILSERRDDHGEDQSDEDKTGRQDDLKSHKNTSKKKAQEEVFRSCSRVKVINARLWTCEPYLCHEVLLASDGVVKSLHQQRMELLQDQSGPFHLPGALPCTAVWCTMGNPVSLHHTIMSCNQRENMQKITAHGRLTFRKQFC